MGVLVAVLAVTNVATLAALILGLRRRRRSGEPLDEALTGRLAGTAAPRTPSGTRRVITIEILNPMDLAGQRSRMFSIAGSVAPALTRRLVYDQTLRTLRDELAARGVAAHVRVHALEADRPAAMQPAAMQPAAMQPAAAAPADLAPEAPLSVELPPDR